MRIIKYLFVIVISVPILIGYWVKDFFTRK